MDTYTKPEFEAGDYVIAVSRGSYDITIGKEYYVTQLYKETGQWFVKVEDDYGSIRTIYAARFGPSTKEAVSPVIAKIRSMDNRRKQLGYKW
jgi:hypothetical protein